MACCATCQFEPCRCPCGFTDPRTQNLRTTLARSLVPCVDAIRNLYTCFGVRSYTVSLVRTQWSGGFRGSGVEAVLSEEVILPTPRVSSLNGVEQLAQSAGLLESGTLRVDQISPRFAEDALQGLGAGGASIPEDQNFYWEVTVLFPDGSQRRRRFFPKVVPNLDMMKFEWQVTLEKAADDRGRDGSPR